MCGKSTYGVIETKEDNSGHSTGYLDDHEHRSIEADGQGGEELNGIIAGAMSKFLVSNPLHPDVFPGVRKMEAEVVAMCLDLYVWTLGLFMSTAYQLTEAEKPWRYPLHPAMRTRQCASGNAER